MESKKCSKCGAVKLLSEFYQRKKYRNGEYYERCKNCFKERGRKYYHDNHARQLTLALNRKQRYKEERRRFLEEIKKNKPCVDCGKIYQPWVMDFDHRDGEVKVASISWMALHDTSNIEKIKSELSKCDLVCANCHRQRTHNRLLDKQNASVANVVKAAV
ncbi:hypothetical protein HY385_00935 [Candidatus Daviesbacteria bacterium]|nr:hypothetical protein [Candidatus Daviesbacteria bacterium]